MYVHILWQKAPNPAPSLLHTALQMTPPAPPQKAYIVYTDKYAAVLKRLKTLPLAR